VNDTMKAIPNSRWDHTARVWIFPQAELAKLKKLGMSEIQIVDVPGFVLNGIEIIKKQKEEINRSKSVSRIMKYFDSKMILSFVQAIEGVKRAVERKGRVLFGDEMGLGKTIQALSVASYFVENFPLLIICPSSLRLTWQSEILNWLRFDEYQIQIILHSSDPIDKTKRIVVISYDLVARMSDNVIDCWKPFGIIICDESHFLKSADAKRTKVILPMLQNAKRVLLLSGTPALSRPMELFTQISALLPEVFKNKHAFGIRYCNAKKGYYGWDYSVILSSLLIRRLKSQVLQQLPDKIRQCVYLEVPSKWKKKVVDGLKSGFDLKSLNDEKVEKKKAISELFKDTGLAKLDSIKEYISELYTTDHNKKFI
ncbi:hypothetical protein HK096_004759, partial [Nowakowskiella sp. JEL0078]